MNTVPTTIVKTLNKTIRDLCLFSIGQLKSENHCSHYVSHIMGYEFKGYTCKNFTWADKQRPEKGAMIRVNEVFNLCKNTGLLEQESLTNIQCLIFVTLKSNIKYIENQIEMGSHPRKHIGILINNTVWHYSNLEKKVVREHLNMFIDKFKNSYKTSGTTVEFYYGALL